MSVTLLHGRPEARFKFSIGLVTGLVIALPLNVLTLTDWQYAQELGYGLVVLVLCALVLRDRAFVVGASTAILLVSLPQIVATTLPKELTIWHLSASFLWLLAFAILGCLYLLREAETRTDADIDAGWLFRAQE